MSGSDTSPVQSAAASVFARQIVPSHSLPLALSSSEMTHANEEQLNLNQRSP